MKALLPLVSALLLSLTICAQPGSGKALEFNGSSSYVSCPSINLSGNAISMQAWIKVDVFKTAFPYITSVMGTETSGNSAFVRLGDASLANNKLQFVLYSGSTQMKLDGSAGLNTGEWYHVAATFDGTTMKIYINGELDASMTASSSSFVSNGAFAIGRNYGNDRILDGRIDEVSVWSAALSQSTIRDWMCQKVTSSHPDYTSLTAYWPLNEGTGSSTADESSNSYNGTLISSPTWRNSGAPIGDESKHMYASAYSLGLSHAQGDSIHIVHTSGTVSGVHLYRVDSVPYVTDAPAPLYLLDTNHYWGVFVVGSSSYAVGYYYDNNTFINAFDDCNIGFADRDNGEATDWDDQSLSAVDYSNQIVAFTGSGTAEYILGVSTNGPHSFSYTLDEPLCNGDSNGSVTAHVTGGLAPYSYAWASGSSDSTATGLSTGYHIFTVTDANGCVSTDSAMLNEPLMVGANVNVSDASCALTSDGSATVNPSGGVGNYTYQWDDPNNSTTATVSGLLAGSYNVTVTDGNGCTHVHPVDVQSTGPDPIPQLGSPDTNVCEGLSVGLVPNITNGPVTTYAWSTGDNGAILLVTTAGTYTVTVTNSNGCSGIDSIAVSFVAPIPVDLGSNVTATGSATLDAGNDHSNFLWNTNATTQTITVNMSGNYSVTASDSNGCESADTVKVTIIPQGIGSPDAKSNIALWPNPASDMLNISDDQQAFTHLQVYDLSGRMVMDQAMRSSSIHVVDVSYLDKGVYILRLRSESGLTAIAFVKE